MCKEDQLPTEMKEELRKALQPIIDEALKGKTETERQNILATIDNKIEVTEQHLQQVREREQKLIREWLRHYFSYIT